MNVKTMILSVSVLAAAAAYPENGPVSGVSWTYDSGRRIAEITYNLSESAIVTIDVCTNGTVSIGPENFTTLAGEVNKEVPQGDGHKILWFADRDWPGHEIAENGLTVVVKAWTKAVPPDYLVVDLRLAHTATSETLRYYADAEAIPGGVTNDLYKTKKLVMRRIPAAGVKWRMGSPVGETGRSSSEPEHYVSFDRDYYIGVYPVTMGQYSRLCGFVPSNAMSPFDMSIVTNKDAHPVGGISYEYNSNDGTQAWLRGASWPESKEWSESLFYSKGPIGRLYALSGIKFDIPTEAQWEYACRAGTGTSYGTGKNCTSNNEANPCANMDEVGWYNKNTATTQPVGLKTPNNWGLYDMHGNVWEWCLDGYGTISETVSSDPVTNPSGAASGDKRVRKGGGYSSGALYCRSASRSSAAATGYYVNNGFRLCCPLPSNW
jgi:formylglycine-generating enzyme required for sulfatase activity